MIIRGRKQWQWQSLSLPGCWYCISQYIDHNCFDISESKPPIAKMCHGHPHHHPCSHQSVTWHYCPSALIDLETGYETPCSNVTFAVSQASNSECPLQNCEFKAKGGSWICCNCLQGPNTQGWCTFNRQQPVLERNYMSEEYSLVETCDHGCCKNCTRDREAPSCTSVPILMIVTLRNDQEILTGISIRQGASSRVS